MVLAAVWPQAYIDYVPCCARTSIDGPGSEANKEKPLEAEDAQRSSGAHLASSLLDYDDAGFVVETFHIPSKQFNEQLVVELYFSHHWNELWKSGLLVVTFRLDNFPSIGSPSGTACMRQGFKGSEIVRELVQLLIELLELLIGESFVSKSFLLQADFATEVYGFLDRAHVGTSLIANRALNELMLKLKNRLPVHHLMCEFERHFDRREQLSGAYWMVVRHFRSDLTYSGMRQFKIPSMAGHVTDCALIIRYLSNSHLFILERPGCYPRFAVKMLAALVDRNVSVDTLRMRDGEVSLSDYRSMDTVFIVVHPPCRPWQYQSPC
ncbi:hypothetical protein AAVH_13350 [Aphelenchoides avenae]|nr:hypothetical protein AAVH_13349 [Aphelenchus avenae]KAH7719192.1 hypothetical protein AAVH_13350 [Aphelenchus avenae]